LGAILSAAALTESVGHAALLLASYSAGLAIPFLATALAFGRMTSAFERVKRHFSIVIGFGGAVLVAMGVLIWTGELVNINIAAQNGLDSLGLDFFDSV
jgi:cytochrome c-type biogenesis protein